MKRRKFLQGLMGAGAIPFVTGRTFDIPEGSLYHDTQTDKVYKRDGDMLEEVQGGLYRIVPMSLVRFNLDNHPFANQFFTTEQDAINKLDMYVTSGQSLKIDEWNDPLTSLTPQTYQIKKLQRKPERDPLTVLIVKYKMKSGAGVLQNVEQTFCIEYIDNR